MPITNLPLNASVSDSVPDSELGPMQDMAHHTAHHMAHPAAHQMPLQAHAPALAADIQANIQAEIEADFWRELQALEAEALGWQELGPGSYLHTGSGDPSTIEVVGLPSAQMAGLQVLWLF